MGELFGEGYGDAVIVVDFDERWPHQAEEFQDALERTLGSRAIRIDHIGSTSVPGLVAKPVIDMLVSVASIEDEHLYRPAIETLDWKLRYREPEWRFFRPMPPAPRVVHVHVHRAGGTREREALLFRDFLRERPNVARAYGKLKVDLAKRFRNDRVAYTKSKGVFVEDVLRAAEEWAYESDWSA